MKEYSGTKILTIGVTIKAKNRKEALSMFDGLYPIISLENGGNQDVEVLNDKLSLIENNWELED